MVVVVTAAVEAGSFCHWAVCILLGTTGGKLTWLTSSKSSMSSSSGSSSKGPISTEKE